MNKNTAQLDELRHSTAHLLAAAVLGLYPKAKPTIGPSIENGFYYDFDNLNISEGDLKNIEKKMHVIVQSWTSFKKTKVTKSEAIKKFSGNSYKKELVEEFSKEGKELTLYKSGEFVDLCRGGHIENPAKELQHFKLISIAGAYWRGSEKNKMLTRIYGTAFPTSKELRIYLNMQEEAKKRDHRKIGKDLELFLFHHTAPGSPYWLPKGLVVFNELLQFWREEHSKRGYLETSTPLINKKELWETSGHWEHYKKNMFIADMGEEDIYGVKAMNCPNAMIIFGAKTRSYKDLPLRFSDSDVLHRYEKSGELSGLFRVRMFRQDDSHNFITENQIESEYKEILDIADRFYSVFGLKYQLRLGTRPDNYMGDNKTWIKAEKSLKSILDKHSGKGIYEIAEGDGAFYGPKVDIIMKDSLGRKWQMGTIQLDFQLPERFGLKYVAEDGREKTPVVVHRVIYGSIERFIGIIIEHFAGAFPVWLSPVQVKVLPITDRNLEYATKIASTLEQESISKASCSTVRVEVDKRNETLQAKIRDAQMEKIPYMIIIGDKEEKVENIAVRFRDGKDLGQMALKTFSDRIIDKIKNKSLDL